MRAFLSRLRRGTIELRVLAGFLVIALLLLAFGFIASEVTEGSSEPFDRAILLALRDAADPSDPIGPPWLEGAVRDVTALGSTAVLGLVSLSAVFYLLMMRQRASALLVTVSVTGGVVLSNLLKLGYARPRPDLVPAIVEVFSASFPSGHATAAAVTYLTLGTLLAELHPSRRLKLYFLSLALLITIAVGISRVYLGVHYPTDVLAGWCIGAAWALLCRTLMLWLRHRRAHPA
jgi:undecaprenyl-diphosphatase